MSPPGGLSIGTIGRKQRKEGTPTALTCANRESRVCKQKLIATEYIACYIITRQLKTPMLPFWDPRPKISFEALLLSKEQNQ